MPVLNRQKCPTCHQSVNEREIGLFKGMITAMYKVWQWCEEKERDSFTRKDIKHLFVDENQIARFGDWALFGLVEKDGRGKYIISLNRTRKFFASEVKVPTLILKDPLTNELKRKNYKYINEVKGIIDFLDENEEFIVQYRGRVDL